MAQSPDLPGLAAGVVAQASLARQAVHRQDRSAALDAIRQAQSMAAEIQSKAAGQALIPVRQETETTTTYVDVKRRKSGEMTPDRMKKRTHVGGVEQQTTSESLNVNTAAERLRAAQADVERGDWTAADTDLANAGALVRVDSAEREMPLPRVERNLMLARTRLAEGKSSAAAAPLREAAQALSDFAKQNPGPAAQQAEGMRQNVEAVASHHHDASIPQIDEWVRTVQSWQKP
jgi:hypothetical protein